MAIGNKYIHHTQNAFYDDIYEYSLVESQMFSELSVSIVETVSICLLLRILFIHPMNHCLL